MSTDYDSNFIAQMQAASRRKADAEMVSAIVDATDPTKPIRAKQANLCEAVMQRVVELETEAERLTEIAKKLRAAVVANT